MSMHGLNIKKIFVGLCSIPKYLFDLIRFFYLHRRINSPVKFKFKLSPVLIDFYTDAGSYKSEYFVQDLCSRLTTEATQYYYIFHQQKNIGQDLSSTLDLKFGSIVKIFQW